MDFTREPIIETVITPKEGCKVVVRSSKNAGQEEYFVDSVEVVSFGNAFFFRSLERPKSFLVPVSDYEILEVREARMVLKNVGLERSIKIGGGRETPAKVPKESHEKAESYVSESEDSATNLQASTVDAKQDARGGEKKRDRRRHYRRRRGRDEVQKEGDDLADEDSAIEEGREAISENKEVQHIAPVRENGAVPTVSSLLPPPTTLISETIARYKDNALFKGAFFLKEDKSKNELTLSEEVPSEFDVQQPSDNLFETLKDDGNDFDLPGYVQLEENPQDPEKAHQNDSEDSISNSNTLT